MSRLWKVHCKEDEYPGMWRRWFRNQCVAVGFESDSGYTLEGRSIARNWSITRKAIKAMEKGDYVVVSLQYRRVGRMGQITGKAIGDDEWNPLVPKRIKPPNGEMGRRILVRWELTTGPESQDLIIQMPDDRRFQFPTEVRPTISQITSMTVDDLREIMNDEKNWVSLSGKFSYERAISDYIAYYSHHLEDGLLPHPDLKVREYVFEGGTRSDVLLIDNAGIPVIVECKQYAPWINAIDQLRGYMKKLKEKTGEEVRGILVHGGAQKVSNEVIAEAKKEPQVEIVSYSLKVDFRPSFNVLTDGE